MKHFVILALTLALMSGCGRTEQAPLREPAPPIILDAPAEFTISQRSTVPLPRSDGKLMITIDDITAGQVLTTLSWQVGKPVVATRSLRQGDVVTFTASNHAYKIKLKELTNVLVGEDSAVFQLWPATAEMDTVLSEHKKIETLILSLGQLAGATFVRNGQGYMPDEAVVHMMKKWEWKKTEIETAKDFIRIVGSKSSTSGKPYVIKMPDGTEVETEEWFKKQLKLMNELPNQRMNADQ
jgi:hypothetical protein